MKWARLLLIPLCAWCGCSAAAELEGQLSLYADGQPLRAEEAAEAIVYFRPRQPQLARVPRAPAVMTTRRKQFFPRLLAIQYGQRVRFPNEDPILHNVFSSSPNNAFDAGLYASGPGVERRFERPGMVKVYCNVHHAMFGYILVLDTPHFTRPDARGRFALRQLPAVEGDLVVFHDRAQPLRLPLRPGATQPLRLRLDLNKRKVPPHMNKFGKPYGGAHGSPY